MHLLCFQIHQGQRMAPNTTGIQRKNILAVGLSQCGPVAKDNRLFGITRVSKPGFKINSIDNGKFVVKIQNALGITKTHSG